MIYFYFFAYGAGVVILNTSNYNHSGSQANKKRVCIKNKNFKFNKWKDLEHILRPTVIDLKHNLNCFSSERHGKSHMKKKKNEKL